MKKGSKKAQPTSPRRRKKEEAETGSATLLNVPAEVVRKLKSELLVFIFGLAVLVVASLVLVGQFPMWAAVTIILLAVIGTTGYVVYFLPKMRAARSGVRGGSVPQKEHDAKAKSVSEKTQGTQKAAPLEEILHRIAYRPEAFQDPTHIDYNIKIVNFHIVFEVKNVSKTGKMLLVTTYIRSPTQTVIFALDTPIKVRRRKNLFHHYEETKETALDSVIQQPISPKEKARFIFRGVYRPSFAFDDYFSRGRVLLLYRIYASYGGKVIIDSGERRIEIPFKKEVKYAKK